MNPLSLLGGGGLSVSPSANSSAQGGTQNNGLDLGNDFYSPFAVGPGSSATATGAPSTSSTITTIAIVAAVAVAAVMIFRRK